MTNLIQGYAEQVQSILSTTKYTTIYAQEQQYDLIMQCNRKNYQLEMWANAHRDSSPVEYRWRPLTPTTSVPCSNAAKMRNPLKFAGVPQTRQQISDTSAPKFTILQGHVGETLLFTKFFPIVDMCLSCKYIARQSL